MNDIFTIKPEDILEYFPFKSMVLKKGIFITGQKLVLNLNNALFMPCEVRSRGHYQFIHVDCAPNFDVFNFYFENWRFSDDELAVALCTGNP